jgi:DNA-binding HxlR family transcriptional regulator
MPDVSEKMLAQRLRELERDGLVARDVRASAPPHVEYRLTPQGWELAPVLQALHTWGTTRATHTGAVVQPVDAP